MKVTISTSFAEDFKDVNDQSLHLKVKEVINSFKTAKNTSELSQIKKISGLDTAYRVGIGFYYIAFIATSATEIMILRLLHRDVILKVLEK